MANGPLNRVLSQRGIRVHGDPIAREILYIGCRSRRKDDVRNAKTEVLEFQLQLPISPFPFILDVFHQVFLYGTIPWVFERHERQIGRSLGPMDIRTTAWNSK